VNDFALRRIDNAVSHRSHAQAQVGILKSVFKVRIKSSELLKEVAANGKATTGNRRRIAFAVHRGVSTIEAIADMPGELVFTNNSAGMPDAVIREELFVTDNSYRGVFVKRTKQSLQPTRLNKSVIIQKDDVFRGGGPGAPIASSSKKHVSRISQTSNSRLQGMQVIPASVCGTIVDNDDFVCSR
jgi:hypothetical protein